MIIQKDGNAMKKTLVAHILELFKVMILNIFIETLLKNLIYASFVHLNSKNNDFRSLIIDYFQKFVNLFDRGVLGFWG